MTPARSPWWAKGFVGFGAVLMVVSLATVGYAQVLLNQVNDAITTDDLLGDDSEPGGDLTGPLNFLVIGSDMRDDWDSAHSDSIMIVHVNETLTSANIISVPRDLYVTIPDCGDLYTSPCQSKVNDAFAAGGKDAAASVQNLAQTLTSHTGITFDGAAMINFDGFADMVETLGSVELCVPFDMTLAHPKGTFVEKGCKDYDARLALGIVRERYSYGPETPGWTPEWGIGDFGRQHMQQHFIKQLLKRAKDLGYMTDPTKVGTLIEGIGDQMLLDLGGRSVIDFAFALRGIDPTALTTIRIPSEPMDINGTSYVVTQPGPQEIAAEALYAAVRTDDLSAWVGKNPDWVNNDK
ncbi:LytR family transcriptional attenuator [Stackebrandtia albiflava]|uniref:LytR family transcriptional attenuator n=2 Tax=Stackebrandtia albiflava TaxID=406432 RepID=A0A562ULI4_9ACTN|nr:LytR family transcriptional attenuator [Stackebrandtia albiflava]